MSEVAVVLDTSALLAYVDGHVAIGELIAEVADERRLVAVPATCLAAARVVAEDDLAASHLLLLATAPTITIRPLGSPDGDGAEAAWRVGEFARGAHGDLGVGHAAHVAIAEQAHLATMRPDIVTPILPRGWSVLDLR